MGTIDLVGSMLLGVAIIAAVIGLNFLLADGSGQATASLTSQQTLSEFQKMIQWDFDKIGYRTPAPVPILSAKADTLRFIADLDNNGAPDTVKYFKKGAQVQSANAFRLYRVVENTADTMQMNIPFTKFDLTYLDSTGAATTVLSKIRGIKVAARLGNVVAGDKDSKVGAYFEQTFYPRNINVPR